MSVDQEDSSMWEFMLEVVSKGADNVVRWLPGNEVVDIDGQPLEPREYQPTLWNFLYSNHLYLAIFVVKRISCNFCFSSLITFINSFSSQSRFIYRRMF